MNKRTFLDPLFRSSPVPVLALGICSALAVTVKLEPALVMALAVTLVTGFSELLLSLIRNTIPNRIRIIVQLMVVATIGHFGRPSAEGLCLGNQQTTFRLCGTHHHQLHHHGSH